MHKALSRLVIYSLIALALGLFAHYGLPKILETIHEANNIKLKKNLEEVSPNQVLAVTNIQDQLTSEVELKDSNEIKVNEPVHLVVSHIATPESVKALYITSWVSGVSSLRDKILKIADDTEINSIVFDIKDYTGKISYPVEDPELVKINSSERRIPDLRKFTNLLHEKNLYVIGRVASFQDPYFVSLHPEYAVKTNTDKEKVWKDRKGISWIDAGEKPVWDYLVKIANDAYAQGVDEIQFDYIRFPSDGNMKDIYYPESEGKDKSEVLTSFFEYLRSSFTNNQPVISADLFGMTATNSDDLGIGQKLEPALINFDFVSPMVYPSHFPPKWNGYTDPQAKPYEVIFYSMSKAVGRAKAIGVSEKKLRPWLQDFGLYGEHYGAKEIRDQIQATYDVGLSSWMLWDPSNNYYAGGLLP